MAEITDNEKPGCAVGVLKSGKILLAKGYGLANLEHRIPFTEKTISDIGSVAKQFTCMAITILEKKGQLSLDDNIQKHLPYIPDFGPPITIRHLVHHTSGIREIYLALALGGYRGGDGIIQSDAKTLVSNSTELSFSPGNQFLYCNTAYMLLADIVATITKEPFESWMKKNIFVPLNMNDTYIMDIQGEVFPDCADSYVEEGESFRKIYDNSTAYGQGGMYTSLVDMIKWVSHFENSEVLTAELWGKMLTQGMLNNGDTLDYARGIRQDIYRGIKRIGHSGSSAGYRTLLAYFPEYDLGVVIKTNTAGIDLGGIVDLIMETEIPEVKEKEKKEEKDEKEKMNSESIKDLTDYKGLYFSPEIKATYEIENSKESLFIRHQRHGNHELLSQESDIFKCEAWFLGDFIFERNGEGDVTGFRLSNGRIKNLYFKKM